MLATHGGSLTGVERRRQESAATTLGTWLCGFAGLAGNGVGLYRCLPGDTFLQRSVSHTEWRREGEREFSTTDEGSEATCGRVVGATECFMELKKPTKCTRAGTTYHQIKPRNLRACAAATMTIVK